MLRLIQGDGQGDDILDELRVHVLLVVGEPVILPDGHAADIAHAGDAPMEMGAVGFASVAQA